MPIYCFLELATGLAIIPGKVIVELFDKQVPKVAENFRALCTGELGSPKYQGTVFHRVVETFTIQGGDTEGTGTGGSHIYKDEPNPFAEEDLYWRDIDEEMLLCMAESPPRSQFFFTLRSSPHLNGLHCCFGKVLRGQQILQQISQVPVDDDDCPIQPITIARCGELEYKGPQKATQPKPEAPPVTEASPKTDDLRSRSKDRQPPPRSRDKARTSEGRRRSRSRQRHHSNRSPQRESSRVDRDRRRYHRHNHDVGASHSSHPYGYDKVEQPRVRRSEHKSGHDESQRVPDVIYKGRGKMMYQANSKSNDRSGRLT